MAVIPAVATWIDASRRLASNRPRCPWIDCRITCAACGYARSYGGLEPPPRVCDECRRCAACGTRSVADHEWPRESRCRVCRGIERPQPADWRARPTVEMDATADKAFMTLFEAAAEVDRRLRRDRRQGDLL